MDVTLYCGSDLPHIQQIYTGFAMLAKQGAIRLRSEICERRVAAKVNGKTLVYDTTDGFGIDERDLGTCDFYFKRSYYPAYLKDADPTGKVVPLGLNYEVYPDFVDWLALKRSVYLGRSLRVKARGALRALKVDRTFKPRLSVMQAADLVHVEKANVLFLTRTWDPSNTLRHGMPTREEINDMRAECISALRREFGHRALAGFAHTPLAAKKYASLLTPGVAEKSKYIATLRNYSVCVATTGLHGSIGWKFGEYVAFAKAIVSEPLNYEVPNLRVEDQFVEFTTPEQCVTEVSRLFENMDLRKRLATNNLKYYQDHLRPDRFVMRTLKYAL